MREKKPKKNKKSTGRWDNGGRFASKCLHCDIWHIASSQTDADEAAWHCPCPGMQEERSF